MSCATNQAININGKAWAFCAALDLRALSMQEGVNSVPAITLPIIPVDYTLNQGSYWLLTPGLFHLLILNMGQL